MLESTAPHISVAAADSALTYDAVIATRNRPEALALSVPQLLAQTRPPERLIVIDASDDPAPVRRLVARLTAGWSGTAIVEESPPGLPLQRNRGLVHVTAPVVLFPDDDSILFPDTAARLLAVYERDMAGDVAAVCAAESMRPPEGIGKGENYRMTGVHRREARLRRLRNRLEKRLTALKPAILLGRSLNRRHDLPGWLAAMDAVPVEYMTGFRMSFRTAAIRPSGFDETLTGYALDEDIDASFTAMRAGLVVGARSAKIYHHRYPGGRGDAYARGRMEVLNRAYVVLKHASGPLGSAALANAIWRRHILFTAVKIATLVPRCGSAAGRQRLAGAWAGHRQAARLWHVPVRDRAVVCSGTARVA